MFRTLDRYIISKFLKTFFFVVLLLVTVISVIDFTEKNGKFIESDPPVEAILFDYYLNYIPYISNMISPLTVFIASVTVTARLASHTEIIAMLAAGTSFRRILVPYLLGGGILAGMIFLLTGWVIPRANETRVAFEKQYLKDKFYFSERDYHVRTAPGKYAYLQSYNNNIHEGYHFTLETIREERLLSKMKADRIRWVDSLGKWRAFNYSIHTFDGMEETHTKGKKTDTSLNLYPKDFKSHYHHEQTLTLSELSATITELRERGSLELEKYRIEQYERYAYPFAIIILTVMGLTVSSRKSRQGVGFQLIVGFILAFIYIFFVILSRNFALAGDVPPSVSAWIPNVTFALITLFLYKRVPK